MPAPTPRGRGAATAPRPSAGRASARTQGGAARPVTSRIPAGGRPSSRASARGGYGPQGDQYGAAGAQAKNQQTMYIAIGAGVGGVLLLLFIIIIASSGGGSGPRYQTDDDSGSSTQGNTNNQWSNSGGRNPWSGPSDVNDGENWDEVDPNFDENNPLANRANTRSDVITNRANNGN